MGSFCPLASCHVAFIEHYVMSSVHPSLTSKQIWDFHLKILSLKKHPYFEPKSDACSSFGFGKRGQHRHTPCDQCVLVPRCCSAGSSSSWAISSTRKRRKREWEGQLSRSFHFNFPVTRLWGRRSATLSRHSSIHSAPVPTNPPVTSLFCICCCRRHCYA